MSDKYDAQVKRRCKHRRWRVYINLKKKCGTVVCEWCGSVMRRPTKKEGAALYNVFRGGMRYQLEATQKAIPLLPDEA